MFKRKRTKNAIIFTSSMALTCVFTFCMAAYLWVTSDSYYVHSADKTSAGSVAQNFTQALKNNKDVKPLVAQYLWPEIDEWMIKHEVFKCSYNVSLNDENPVGGLSILDLDTRIFTSIDSVYCSDVEGFYSFEVKNLILKRFDGEWVVYGWDEICERRPGENECRNPLED